MSGSLAKVFGNASWTWIKPSSECKSLLPRLKREKLRHCSGQTYTVYIDSSFGAESHDNLAKRMC
eukprot:5709535-Amphidinium_carterae.1